MNRIVFLMNTISGGSRISQKGRQTLKVHQPIIWPPVSKKHHENEEILA